MATLADTMVSDMDNVFLNTDEHAVPISYTPKSTGTPVSIKGIFDPHEDAEIKPVPDGMGVNRNGSLVVADNATTGVLRPKHGDLFHVTRTTHPLYNVVYMVVGSQPEGHGAHYLNVFRHDNYEKTASQYRVDRGR